MEAKDEKVIPKETADTLQLTFDKFQRYKVVADIINKFRKNKEIFKILEVGAGGEETLKKFLPHDNFIFLDKELLPEDRQKSNYILEDITEKHIVESYDFVVSIDTYEHIHQSSREIFINELIHPSNIATIIAAPFDTPGVKESEVIVNEAYVLTYDTEYRWLHEHIQNGLPSLSYTLELIEKLGLNYTVIPNGYLPRWIDMISTYLLTEGMPEFSKIIEELSVFYNKNLYQYDSISPAYRQVIIIKKEGRNPDFSDILTKDFNSEDFKIKYEMLQSILTNIRALYNPYRYNQIKTLENNLQEKERQINELNAAVQGRIEHIQNFERQIADISSHLSELNVAIQGKDAQIRDLDRQITDFSSQLTEKEQQIEELNVAVREKDTQLRNFDELKTTISSYIKEKDKQIDELDITIQESDEQIRDLEEQITDISGRQKEKEQRITELNVALLGKDKQILNLDGQIANISGQRKEREERLGEIEMQNSRIDSELSSIKQSASWRTVMKWHSFIEKSMPQGTRKRRYYDLSLIGLRTITNEGGKSFWWKYKQHRSSRKHKELITKSTEGKILENTQDRTEMLDPMDDYTKKTKIWLDNRFKLCDNEGIYIAHQPIYGFRKGHSEPGLADKYCRTYQIMKALSYLEFNSLLDVGGAEGYKAHVVKEIFDTEVRNSDLSEEACKRCEEIFHIRSDPIDLHNLPYDDDAFEVILCSETLEHVTDWRKAINELFRVASKAIVITVPHEDEAVIRESIKHGIPHGHIHNFTPNSFNFLEFEGYTVISKKIISKYFRLLIEPELKYSQNSGCTRLIKTIFGKKIASVIIKSDNLFVKFGKRFDGILFVILKDKKALLEHKKKKISAHQIISIEVPYYYLK